MDSFVTDRTLEFTRKFYAKSPWVGMADLHDETVLAAVEAMRANPMAYVEITEIGAIGGVVTPLWFSDNVLLAVELFWYSESAGEGKRLRENFEAWSREKGAVLSQLSCMANSSEKAVRRLMGRAGYDAKEIALIKAL